MNNTLIFVRHAKTKVDKTVPIEDWVLTEDGEKCAQELVNNNELFSADVFISSDEEKAYLTIKPLADKLGKEIIRIAELGEIQRPNSEKLTSREYEEMKTKIFTDLDYTSGDWETANHALTRFGAAVAKIDSQYSEKKIVICAHGTVMTLYFAKLTGKMDQLFDRWGNLEFGKVGIVKNGKVVKDIV